METCNVTCDNYSQARFYANHNNVAAKYEIKNVDKDLTAGLADGWTSVTLHYSQTSLPPSAIVKMKIGDSMLPFECCDVTKNDCVVPTELVKLPEKEVLVPYFTDEYPFMSCAMNQTQFPVFDPQPDRISAIGVCYPPKIQYRILTAKHTFPLSNSGSLIQYTPFRIFTST